MAEDDRGAFEHMGPGCAASLTRLLMGFLRPHEAWRCNLEIGGLYVADYHVRDRTRGFFRHQGLTAGDYACDQSSKVLHFHAPRCAETAARIQIPEKS
jgi:hypothetical protein